MSEYNGFIEDFSNGHIRGWVVTHHKAIAKIYCDDQYITDITNTFLREDVIAAGLTNDNAGFNLDISEQLADICGEHVLSIRIADSTIAENSFFIPSGRCLIKNPFFNLKDLFNITDAHLDVNHRVGLSLERYLAPTSLNYSNGGYTRFAFADSHNSKLFFELELDLDLSDINSESLQPLEFALVAKSSQLANIHVRFIDKNSICLLDEPITIDPRWDLKKFELSGELSQKIRNGNVKVILRSKHHGRRTIDLSMVCLAESVGLFKTPKQIEVENEIQQQQAYDANVLRNGDFTSWSKGIVFPKLARGQELADNWFVEMNQGNEDKINVAVLTDNKQVDPLANNIQAKLGLRVRAGALEGYARLLTTINKINLAVMDYAVDIDIEAMNLGKKVVLPRIYLIARNTVKDTVVADIARKTTVNGRQILRFALSATQVEKLLLNQVDKPVLALAIDLTSGIDFTIFSTSLSVNTVAMEQNKPTEIVGGISRLAFEDESITAQLTVLKGLESWLGDKPISFNTTLNSPMKQQSSLDEFSQHVTQLTPHKMHRPSRNFPFIDVIVPVYNACDDVLLCLSALVEKTDITHRVIVINDGEDPRTASMLAAFHDHFNHIEVVTNPQNIGYTKSVNKGIKHANADWVVVLNSDTIVSEGWLGRLMNCAQSTDNVGMVGALSNAASWQSVPRIHDETGDWHLNPLPQGMSIDDMSAKIIAHSTREYPKVGVINGFCQLINMSMLDEIGLLDDVAFPVGYGEENDMCARAVKAGYTLLIADDTYIFHAKSKSFGHEKRKVLAKQGSEALKKKHPDVDWNAVTKLIRENPALTELREQMVIEFNQFTGEKA
jgi:GT2 family glycosyltransferase